MRIFLIIVMFLTIFLTGCGNNDNLINTQEQNNNYNASGTTTIDNTTDINNTNNSEIKNNINTETEISKFSTKIYTPNDEARQNNIRITCSKLNGTIVKSRRNFFFL